MTRHKWTSVRRLAAMGLFAGLFTLATPQGFAQDTEADADVMTVSALSVGAAADGTKLTLVLSEVAEGAAISSFLRQDPHRLIIDVADARAPEVLPALTGDSALVDGVSAETREDRAGSLLRLTVLLTGPVDHTLEVVADHIDVRISPAGASVDDPLAAATQSPAVAPQSGAVDDPIAAAMRGTSGSGRQLSGPAVADAASLSSLDFEAGDTRSRIIIGTTTQIDYTVKQPESNLVVVDFPNTALPSSLGRPLDTSKFISPVRNVQAYRTRSGTRVAISLRRAAEHSVSEDGGLIYVDLALSAEMQAERQSARSTFAVAAPSTPETEDRSLKGAYQQEVLIGASGRTVRPDAVFGAGGGAHDPASLVGKACGFAADPGTSAMSGQFSGDPITINLVNADIQSVFRFIGEHAKLNVVAGDDVKGKVTLRLNQVPWDQGFAAILHSKGLGCQQFGNIVRVAPLETMKAEQTSALEAKRAAQELQELELIVIPINYGQADDLKAQVSAVLSDRGSVEVDSRSNQLIVRETHEKVGQVRELVRQLDKQTPQVLIECRIVEANSSYSRGLGIQWGGELDASASSGYSTGMFFPNAVGTMGGLSADGEGDALFYSADTDNLLADLGSPVGESSALAMSLGSVTGLLDLDVRLSAMEQEGWGKIVSQPRVLTLDNEAATIKQGSKIPYLSTSAGGTNVQFVNATLALTVTPHITSDERVFLDIQLENNRADFSNTIQGQPAISVKEAQTSLLVKNGDTTVIGGVFSTENTFQQSRIPFLSKIPLLGYLFKNSGEGTTRNELLVFITPRIVSRAQAS